MAAGVSVWRCGMVILSAAFSGAILGVVLVYLFSNIPMGLVAILGGIVGAFGNITHFQ